MKKNFLILCLLTAVFITATAQKITVKNDSIHLKAISLLSQNNQEKALQLALQEIDKTSKNSNEEAKWNSLIGDIFNKNQELNKALYYYKKALATNRFLHDSLAVMENYLKIGKTFNQKYRNLYDVRHTPKALQLKDSADFYYQNIITNYNNTNSGAIHLAQTYSNLAFLYADLDKLDSAQNYITKAIHIYENKLALPLPLNGALNNQGLIYIYQKKYDAAEKTHLKVIKNVKDTTTIKALGTVQDATTNLAYIYKKTKKYTKAFEYYQKERKLSEMILKKQKAIEIRTIEAEYNEEKARAEEAVKTEKQRQAKKRTQYALIGTGMFSAIVILLGTVMYRNSKLKAKSLAFNLVTQELNQQKTLRLLEEKNQQKLLSATLDGREIERKDIAQTLHDSVSALLSSANMHIQVARKKSANSIEELDKSQHIIHEASEKVRDLSHKLISAVLLKFGLEHAVYDMCEKYSNAELEFELETHDKIPRFEQSFEIKIHNIIEECINNIIKHSKASLATVAIDYSNNILDISITDNGIGFDTSKITPNSGIGLSQIKARIENLDGIFTIQSSANNGTLIKISLPVTNT